MTTPDWCQEALSGVRIVQIGQIDAPTVKRLNALVHQGKLARTREPWTTIGGMPFGPTKTVWRLSPRQGLIKVLEGAERDIAAGATGSCLGDLIKLRDRLRSVLGETA